MTKRKIIIVIIVLIVLIGIALAWQSYQQSQRQVQQYINYTETTRVELAKRHQALAAQWDVDNKSIPELNELLRQIEQQVEGVNQRRKDLPSVSSGLLQANIDIDRSKDIDKLSQIADHYQELRDRVAIKRDSEVIERDYDNSRNTMEDYKKAMRALSIIAKQQLETSHVNQTDKRLAEQYDIIVKELDNANRAEARRDRQAYDMANRKIDQADRQIRAQADAINDHYQTILSEIKEKIDQLR